MFLTPGGQTRFPKKCWFMFKRSELPALKQLKQTFTVWTEISVFWCLITMKGKVITRLTRRRRLPTTKVFVMIWWGSLKNVPACPDQQSDSSYRHAAELGDGSVCLCRGPPAGSGPVPRFTPPTTALPPRLSVSMTQAAIFDQQSLVSKNKHALNLKNISFQEGCVKTSFHQRSELVVCVDTKRKMSFTLPLWTTTLWIKVILSVCH